MLRRTSRAIGLLATLALAVPLAATLPSATAAPAAAAHRAAAPGDAPVTLWAPEKATAYAYRHRAWTDLGLRMIAEGSPFELWSDRPSYDDPIQTVWRSPDGDVPLPTGSMKTFSGLKRFLSLDIDARKRGVETRHLTRTACLNGWSERVRAEAPARSPYPTGCWYNPYSLGSVQGIQTGWATTLLSNGGAFRLEPGVYDVTARIAPRYAEAFGMTAAEASVTVELTVAKESGGEGRHAHPSTPSRTAQPAAHAPTGPAGRRAEGPEPDLRSLPAWGINVAENGNYLRFSATVWNAGDSPLVVDGFRRDGEDLMDAYQYFFDADGNQTGYQPVGTLHFDHKPSHQHWHFEDFARYSLLDKDKVEAVVSKKEAFCLANTDSVDLTVPGAAWKPENTDLATSCGDVSSLSIREVLAAGWGDTYTQYRAGQSFNLRGLPNGTYYIAVAANPDGNLVESATDNNVSLRKVFIRGKEGARKVRVPQVGIIDEEGYGGTG